MISNEGLFLVLAVAAVIMCVPLARRFPIDDIEAHRLAAEAKKREGKEELFIVNADEWQGLYVNGKLACSNHGRISIYQVLEALGLKYETELVNEAWIKERQGRLPDNLQQVKLS